MPSEQFGPAAALIPYQDTACCVQALGADMSYGLLGSVKYGHAGQRVMLQVALKNWHEEHGKLFLGRGELVFNERVPQLELGPAAALRQGSCIIRSLKILQITSHLPQPGNCRTLDVLQDTACRSASTFCKFCS